MFFGRLYLYCLSYCISHSYWIWCSRYNCYTYCRCMCFWLHFYESVLCKLWWFQSPPWRHHSKNILEKQHYFYSLLLCHKRPLPSSITIVLLLCIVTTHVPTSICTYITYSHNVLTSRTHITYLHHVRTHRTEGRLYWLLQRGDIWK